MERIKAIKGDSFRCNEVYDWLVKQCGATAIPFTKIDLSDNKYLYYVVDNKVLRSRTVSDVAKLVEIVELPKWRAEFNEMYFYITDTFKVSCKNDLRHGVDEERWKANNYFKTSTDAMEFLNKMLGVLYQNNE